MSAYKKQFYYYRSLAEKAVIQITDQQIFEMPSAESNSIAIIMKHMAGNMLSRWTDVLHTDGEKTWRNRDDEFINTFNSKEELLNYWAKGWKMLEATLEGLSDEDLETIIYIRNMGCTLHDAIIRQISHYAYHVGQIVFTARLLKGNEFKSLSIPKNQSKSYNQDRFAKEKTIKSFIDDEINTNLS